MKEKYLVIFKVLKQLSGNLKDNPELQKDDRNIGEFDTNKNQIIFFDKECNEIKLVVGVDCEIIEKF